MAFTFEIVLGSGAPIYRQLIDQVNLAVAAGALSPGSKMPSVRAVAEALLINPNTVARAYTELVQAGVLESEQGRGVFVAERRQRLSEDEREQRLERAVGRFISEVIMLGYPKSTLVERVSIILSELELAAVTGS